MVQPGVESIDVSWTSLTFVRGPNRSIYTYLVMYKTVNSGKNENVTIVTNSTTTTISNLSRNALYSVQLVAFDSSSIVNASIYSCPRLVKTNSGKYKLYIFIANTHQLS
jgi:archaellin